MQKTAPPINIFSGATSSLGAALTNPTELGRSKGTLTRTYRVTYAGKLYGDAESAYQVNKTGNAEQDDQMMIEVICAKFLQHPDLAEEVRTRGGSTWLAQCSHLTGARTEGAQAWEGVGMQSRFIRNLVAGWDRYLEGDHTEQGQRALF